MQKSELIGFLASLTTAGGVQAIIAWVVGGLTPLQVVALVLTIIWSLINILKYLGVDIRIWNRKKKDKVT